MIGAFQREGDEYRAAIQGESAEVLQRLIREILTVLDEPSDVGSFIHAAMEPEAEREQPEDPALANLLPPMSTDQEEAARLRAFTEDYLRSEKSSRLRTIDQELRLAQGNGMNAIIIPVKKAWEWLAALNDIRLALAGELRIRSDEDAYRIVSETKDLRNRFSEVSGEQQDSGMAQEMRRQALSGGMYVALTWWQDSLLQAVRRGD